MPQARRDIAPSFLGDSSDFRDDRAPPPLPVPGARWSRYKMNRSGCCGLIPNRPRTFAGKSRRFAVTITSARPRIAAARTCRSLGSGSCRPLLRSSYHSRSRARLPCEDPSAFESASVLPATNPDGGATARESTRHAPRRPTTLLETTVSTTGLRHPPTVHYNTISAISPFTPVAVCAVSRCRTGA